MKEGKKALLILEKFVLEICFTLFTLIKVYFTYFVKLYFFHVEKCALENMFVKVLMNLSVTKNE